MSELHDRIIEISKKHHLAHLGSTLTAVNIIDEIYKTKSTNEKFILSAGHMGLALFVVIEKYEGVDAESIYLHHGVHPDRCEKCHLYCSTGSLGNGLPIALGMAMADRTKNVYCLISDGEAFEGTIWETANVMRRYSVTNLKVYLNYNSYSAYDIVDKWMIDNLKMIMPIEVRRTDVEDYGLEGLSAHYITL
jgi:transketolase N-terminal domain/subunit